MRPIKLAWFRYQYPEKVNFGDELSPLVVNYATGKRVEWADFDNCDLVAMGSILGRVNNAAQKYRRSRIQVWGAGHMFSVEDMPYELTENLLFHAIRGPLSKARQAIVNRSLSLGDPGLLVSEFIKRRQSCHFKVGLVPHYVDQDDTTLNVVAQNSFAQVINVLDPPITVVEEISSCDLILSSSLHGIVCADSYGIPAYWLKLSNKVAGSGFKYRDYFLNFDLPPQIYNIRETFDRDDAENLIAQCKRRKGVERIKRRLMKSAQDISS